MPIVFFALFFIIPVYAKEQVYCQQNSHCQVDEICITSSHVQSIYGYCMPSDVLQDNAWTSLKEGYYKLPSCTNDSDCVGNRCLIIDSGKGICTPFDVKP